MNRPLLLDLFCGAGGAAVWYARAGFEVVGIDIKPQPNYPFTFHQYDALEFLRDYGMHFDAVHASPPCQHYARVTRWRGKADDHPDLIAETRSALDATGLPWVMENVTESVHAGLRPDYLLCGSMFGLNVRRHRVFETSPRLRQLTSPCDHHRALLPFEHKGERAYADAMGCTWMSSIEAREAIPPAYTQYIGEQLLASLKAAA